MNWRQFWGLCEHKWVVKSEAAKIRTRDGAETGTIYGLQCEKCGDLKSRFIGTV
jgi:uncharacterized OB-fold protein